MSNATSRMSSAAHAACDHDVKTGVTRVCLLMEYEPIVMQGIQKPLTTEDTGDTEVRRPCTQVGRCAAQETLSLFLRDRGVNPAVGEAGGDFVSKLDVTRVFEQLAFGIKNQRVAAFENCQR